ncbi:MAG TPA: tRNA (guanosine(37)-N1)-methyltransferase TrmD [Silvibacterium sp.]|nr:tRNA (guanosine(37)-N1)-methyltransferase TrmD [Silvibacterium sp.]
MRFDIVTIFPGLFAGFFEHGVVKRAIAGGLVEIRVHDLRDFTNDRHRTVDDRPFGGGEGMVLKPEPLAEALEVIGITNKAERDLRRESVILLSAQGRKFRQATAREFAKLDRVTLLCGRYEGVDERVNVLLADRELSIGDYVLSGGELGAAVVVDATMRLLPGVLGNEASSQFESFGRSDAELAEAELVVLAADSEAAGGNGAARPAPSSTYGAGGLLDYPHYTRPAEFRGLAVPEVLSGGDHDKIRRWRRERALEKTLRNRPDLLETAELSEEDRAYLESLGAF